MDNPAGVSIRSHYTHNKKKVLLRRFLFEIGENVNGEAGERMTFGILKQNLSEMLVVKRQA